MTGFGRVVRLVVGAAPLKTTLYVVVSLAGGVLPVVTVWLTKLVLDGIGAAMAVTTLVWLAVALAAAGIAAAALPAAGRYLRAELGRDVRLVAQQRLFAAVDRFDGLARFEDPVFLDRLRLARQSADASADLVDAVLGVLKAVVLVCGLLGSLFAISPGMVWILLGAAVPALFAELALARRRAAVAWTLGPVERREMFYGQLLSSVEAAKEVRLFGLGRFLRDRMSAETRASNKARGAVDRREVFVHSGLSLLAALVAGGGLVWAIGQAGHGRLTVGDIALFVSAVAGVQTALGQLVSSSAIAHQCLLLFGHYTAVLDAEPDLTAPARPATLGGLRSGIELRDVWFRYSDEHDWVLRGVNLHIPCGSALGLVGRNGAGKSTLVKLLCRFYDPTRGAILWDGVDLRDAPAADLRARISGVFQDFMNYEFTAAENVALGDLDALPDRTRLTHAARLAGIDDVLTALPKGYDTLLSRNFFEGDDTDDAEHGVLLSGGQWQRLALARALLREDRDLMILDEPSAGLDAQAEYEVHSALRAHRQQRTSVLVSHRLGAIREADLIVVLSGGVITESGTHAELLSTGGTYADLFTLQAAGYSRTSECLPSSTSATETRSPTAAAT